jgi:hypothetical protein
MPNNLQLHLETAVQGSNSICYPAVGESGAERLILNGLHILDLPKRRFQYTILKISTTS